MKHTYSNILSALCFIATSVFPMSLFATPEISVEQPAGTGLTDNAAIIDWGNVGYASFPTKTFRVRNTGTSVLSGIAVTIDGADAARFTVTSNPAATVAAGAFTSFTVRFTPGTLGPKSAQIHVASNDADENPFDVTVQGTGVDNLGPREGTMSVSPSSFFAPYNPGTELTVTFAGWTDLSLPLSYSLAGTVTSPQGPSSARTFNLPAEPGVFRIYGSIWDALGNRTQRPAIALVKPVRSWSVLAGSGHGDGVGSNARFQQPYDVAADSSGNLYVADGEAGLVRRVSSTGAVMTVAGTFLYGETRDGARGASRFETPQGIAVDRFGTVYVAANQLRKISSAGVVTTVGDGLQACTSVAVDGDGNLYVTESYLIKKVTPAGVVSIFAGDPLSPGSADGTGTAAQFNWPEGVAVDSAGNVYVADTSNATIRKITPAGVVTTLAGTAGQHGNDDGVGAAARFSNPQGVALDASGNVYVAESQAIRKVTPAGVVTTLLDASSTVFSYCAGLTVDADGNVFFADIDARMIWKLTPAGVVSVVAGTDGQRITDGPGANDGVPSIAMFDHPRGVVCDASGNSFVVDAFNGTIRKVTSAGVVSTFAGTARQFGSLDGTGSAARFGSDTGGIAINAAGELFVADYETVRKITPAGVVTTLAGTAGMTGSADGTGSAARFSFLRGIAVDAAGDAYVSDAGNNTIRKITSTGVVTTLAGLAGVSGSTDGTGAAARFNEPWGLTIDANGDLLVADAGNSTIRKVTPAGVVTTFAGSAGVSGYVDGPLATARFYVPVAITTGADGVIYVTENGTSRIRRISASGYVSTVATDGYDASGFFGSEFQSGEYEGLAIRSDGTLIATDSQSHRIVQGKLLSSNADLAALTNGAGAALSPSFSSGTTSYTATVPQATAGITLTPTLAQAGATSVTVNG